MDGPTEYYISWSDSKTNTIWYHLYVESKNNTNEFTYKTNRFTDIENKLMVTKGEQEVERDRLGVWN